MKAKVNYSFYSNSEIIDLEYFGHSENTKFEDLTNEEKAEIFDYLFTEKSFMIDIETVES